MKVTEVVKKLGYSLVPAFEFNDKDVVTGYTSDLLSDVMGNADNGCALITIQAHRNTIAVAALIGASLVVICNGRDIPAEMIEAAKEEKLAIAITPDNQYTASYKLAHVLAK